MDLRRLSRFGDAATAVVIVSAPFRREPPPLSVTCGPASSSSPIRHTHVWAGEGDPAELFGENDLYFTVGGNIGSPLLRSNLRHSLAPAVASCRPGVVNRRLWLTTTLPPLPIGITRATSNSMVGSSGRRPRNSGNLLGCRWRARSSKSLISAPTTPISMNSKRMVGGWSPDQVRLPEMYRDVVVGSAAEFSCAKGGYAGTRCGWFSDRSECFLAAGRPVVLQSTGFEDLPDRPWFILGEDS